MAVILFAGGPPAVAADAPPQNDAELFQGRWRCIETRGGEAPIDVGFHIQMWNDMCFGTRTHVRCVLRPEESPKEIDFVTTGQAPERIPGIYRLEGNRLTIAQNRDARPAAFEATPGTNVAVYERDPENEEERRIQGLWQADREDNGIVLATGYYIYNTGFGRYVVRPDATPKEIDIRLDNRTLLGIYRLNPEGDRLTIYRSPTTRPAGFDAERGPDSRLDVYTRREEGSADPDFKPLYGVWKFVRTTKGPLALRNCTIDCKGAAQAWFLQRSSLRCPIVDARQEFRANLYLVLDSTKRPKQILATVTWGKGKGRRELPMAGVYRLEGDTLTIVFGERKNPATQFAFRKGDPFWQLVLEREKP
jgi:uncharacterized protein (TIGR03067 family)